MKSFKLCFLLLTLAVTSGILISFTAKQEETQNYVPDEATAIKVAEAILTPIYGKEVLKKEKPLIAILKGNIWTVTGTLHYEKGGVASIQIQKSDCKVLFTWHGK
jgi:hypothetical protein